MLGRAYDKALASAGINNTQLTVLRCIARRAGEPLARLADEWEMEQIVNLVWGNASLKLISVK